MTTPIPDCPQEDKPIRDRAWTEGQLAVQTANQLARAVSDADVEAALSEFHDWTGLCDDERDDAQHRVAMRAALERFAKGERHD